MITGVAQMYGVECDIQHLGSTKSGESSPSLREKVRLAAEEISCFSEIIDYTSFGATEDFSLLMTTVQQNGGCGNYCMLGADLSSGHHTNYFDFDESVLVHGVALLVSTVLSLVEGQQK